MCKKIKTVPNQRTLKVNKSATDKSHKYTINNLEALAEASQKLQSLGGFKLYMYIAKNQSNFEFALSSADFKAWCGLGYRAYSTAFTELVKVGYLIPLNSSSTYYFFRDKLDIAPPVVQTNTDDIQKTKKLFLF